MCVGQQGQFQFGPNFGEQTNVFTRENGKEGGRKACVPAAGTASEKTQIQDLDQALLSQVPASFEQSFAIKVPQGWSLLPARMGN